MYKDRLILIRNHFEKNVPENRFDLSTWAGTYDHPWKGKEDLSCGTVGCVIGWSSTIPEFRELGFYLIKESPESKSGIPSYKGKRAFKAVEELLDLTNSQVKYLFYDYYYPKEEETSKQEVLERIDAFLEYQMDDNEIDTWLAALSTINQ